VWKPRLVSDKVCEPIEPLIAAPPRRLGSIGRQRPPDRARPPATPFVADTGVTLPAAPTVER
jgi:hypothetical protein